MVVALSQAPGVQLPEGIAGGYLLGVAFAEDLVSAHTRCLCNLSLSPSVSIASLVQVHESRCRVSLGTMRGIVFCI